MYVHMQDLVVMYLVTMSINVMLVILMAVWLYCHFTDKLDQATSATRRLRTKVSWQADELKKQAVEIKKLQIFNPPAEEIPPPAFDIPVAAEPTPPMAEEVPAEEPSPYNAYLTANQELWKLRVKGEDQSDYADYLRGVMDECYVKLDQNQKENVEREAADAWKHV